MSVFLEVNHTEKATERTVTDNYNPNCSHHTLLKIKADVPVRSGRLEQRLLILDARSMKGPLPPLLHPISHRKLLSLLLKKVSSARLGESDIHPISSKTPAPQCQPIDRKKRMGKRVEDYSRDRAA